MASEPTDKQRLAARLEEATAMFNARLVKEVGLIDDPPGQNLTWRLSSVSNNSTGAGRLQSLRQDDLLHALDRQPGRTIPAVTEILRENLRKDGGAWSGEVARSARGPHNILSSYKDGSRTARTNARELVDLAAGQNRTVDAFAMREFRWVTDIVAIYHWVWARRLGVMRESSRVRPWPLA